MRIAVIGAGGVGGGFGAALAKAGADVTFVARGAHLAAMKAYGLRVTGGRDERHIVPTQATDDPASIGPVDIVIFCVKLWDVESAGAAIRPLIGPHTGVIPLQNGIDAADRLVPILGAGAVMGGVAQISAAIVEPGVIRQTGTMQRMIFGELDGSRSARAESFLAACRGANFDIDLTADIRTALWEKFVILVGISSLTAITRLPIGKLRHDPDILWLLEAIQHEVVAVGRAEGIVFAEDFVATRMAGIAAAPPTTMASMAVDLTRGNRIELPWLAGRVVELGRARGVPTPVAATVLAALKSYVAGPPA